MLTSRQMIPFIASLAMLMESIDATVINTAIPTMANNLMVNPIDLKVALISYLLSLAIFIPISGWLSDKLGIKRVFIGALTIFILASMWCGLANSLWSLVMARSLQGVGGSLMLPVGRLLIVRTFARHELVNIMSRVVMIGALGLMLGPTIGGIIVHHFSWRWIFWINIPIGLFNILLAWIWLIDTPPQAVRPLDKLGFILFGTGLAGLTFALSAFSETTVPIPVAFAIFFSSLFLLLCYSLHSRHHTHPIIKTELFRFRTFQISILGNLVARLGFNGMPFLLPLLLQIGLGYSAQAAGILLAPMALGVLLVKPFSLAILRLLGFKRLLILNTLLLGVTLWAFMFINVHTSLMVIASLIFVFGFLMALQYSGMNSLAYADLPAADLSSATSVLSTLQQIAQSFGVAVSALLLRYFSSLTTNPALLSTTTFYDTFFVVGIITMLSTFVFVRLTREDGRQMTAGTPP